MSVKKLFDLSGRTALVTGSSRGIGAAIALGLAECGADVAVHCVSRRDEAQKIADQIKSFGVKSGIVAANLAEDDAPKKAFDSAVEILGRVDILVSNVSIQIRSEWNKITRDDFEKQVSVNWRASLELMQLAIPEMTKRNWGRVLSIGSVQQRKPNREMLIYAAAKAAQTNMVQNLAVQVAPFGVTVNNLAPGVIGTDRNSAPLSDQAIRETVLKKIPAGFIGQSEDCVGAAILLCSDAGRYITGQDFYVDGGMSL
jgi:glucose 1-dehydrogenase